jgi:hypothetical protein
MIEKATRTSEVPSAIAGYSREVADAVGYVDEKLTGVWVEADLGCYLKRFIVASARFGGHAYRRTESSGRDFLVFWNRSTSWIF